MPDYNPYSPPSFPSHWASQWGEDRYGLWQVFVYKTLSLRFRWIVPGAYKMGSPETEAEREPWSAKEDYHTVTLTEGFWLAETTVTQQLWEQVMGENPSHFKGKAKPVEQVSWNHVQDFIKKLQQSEVKLTVRLPWEAEWEYACRAGTTMPFSFGNTITAKQVNYDANYPYGSGEKGKFRKETVNVASLPCNAWGLYEMHGNVWEWCQDRFQANLGTSPVVDPWKKQEFKRVAYRVLRGGSWNRYGGACRSAMRDGHGPGNRSSLIGFRLILGH